MDDDVTPLRRWAARVIMLGAAVVGALMTAGCESDSDQRRVSLSGTAPSAAVSAAAPTFSRSCAIPPRVSGKLPSHWRQRSARIGPVYLYRVGQYRNQSARDLAPLPATKGRRYAGNKQLIIIQSTTPVTLAVAARDRGVVSLMYNEARFDHGYALSDGTSAVTFQGCDVPVTQWSGAFVVAGARCVGLVVRNQHGLAVGRRNVPYGRGRC